MCGVPSELPAANQPACAPCGARLTLILSLSYVPFASELLAAGRISQRRSLPRVPASRPTCRKRTASTVNAHLAALDHFYEHLGLGAVRVRRDQLPRRSPKALSAREQKHYLRAVERKPLTRYRAIGRLLFYAGLRGSELTPPTPASSTTKTTRPPPHTLRHTFGTSCKGVDIVVVAELMGHRRLDTTRLYTLPTDADLEDAVAKLPADQ
jgi:integrase